MIPDYLFKDYKTLFRGRTDVYGHNEGRCVKEPLTDEVLNAHLEGKAPMGVYPMVPKDGEHYVVWGCSDFDTTDALDNAIKLYDTLEVVGITSWIERSRSKGYHVWVFAETPVHAKDMRNMFLAAHAVAEVPALEVNPKQPTLGVGQYGNYVRLPYPDVHDAYTDKQRFLYRQNIEAGNHGESKVLFLDFCRKAMAQRTPAMLIESIAGMYKEHKPVTINTDYLYDATLDEAMQSLSALGKVIWRDGPLEGNDRSRTLTKLGHECVRSGLNPSQTKTIIKTADIRWGKYHLRTNGEDEIDKLVVRVHS